METKIIITNATNATPEQCLNMALGVINQGNKFSTPSGYRLHTEYQRGKGFGSFIVTTAKGSDGSLSFLILEENK